MPWVTAFHTIPVWFISLGHRPVIHIHNARPHEPLPLSDRLTRLALRPASRFVAHAERIADDLHELGLKQECTVCPLPPLIPLDRTALPSGNPALLFLGYVRDYKGLDIALDALATLPDRFTLTVAGEFWTSAEEWADRVDQLGLSDRVRLISGYQSDEEVRALFASHHIVVCPYRSATQSGIVPLAHAAGRPVVATRVGGLHEAVRDGVDGVLCQPTPTDFADAVTRAASDLEHLADGTADSASLWTRYATALTEPS